MKAESGDVVFDLDEKETWLPEQVALRLLLRGSDHAIYL
jgi:hypothetical protein